MREHVRWYRSVLHRWMATILATCGLACVTLATLPTQPAGAAADSVTNCNDSGPGSLRQAVADANPGDTITFAPSPCTTITLTSGVIQIGENLTIDGPGAAALAVSGDNSSTVFATTCLPFSCGVTVAISGLTIEDGSASVDEYGETTPYGGGAIFNSGTLTVSNCVFSNDLAAGAQGGAIASNTGTLDITNSTFTDDSASSPDGGTSGGAISNQGGAVTVTGSTFTGNSAAGGAGIYSGSGSLSVATSIFSNNSATYEGGGIDTGGGTLTVSDSTFTGNTAPGQVGGGAIANRGTATITASTLASNTAAFGGGVSSLGDLKVDDSTIAGNTGHLGGGGIFSQGSLTVNNSTIWENLSSEDAGGIYSYSNSSPILTATIVGHNTGDCMSQTNVGATYTITDGGFNLDDDGSCGFSGTSLSDTPADLDTAGLQNNGGPTLTIALDPGSPAIGYITESSACPATDQRGYVVTAPCDIGAYDTSATAPEPPTTTPEAPIALLLPLAGLALFGIYAHRRRARWQR